MDEEFKKREIETGLSDGLKIEITGGVSNGAVVRIP